MASQMSIYAAQFSDEHLDASVAISYKYKQNMQHEQKAEI